MIPITRIIPISHKLTSSAVAYHQSIRFYTIEDYLRELANNPFTSMDTKQKIIHKFEKEKEEEIEKLSYPSTKTSYQLNSKNPALFLLGKNRTPPF